MSLVDEFRKGHRALHAQVAANAKPDTGISMRNGWPVKVKPPVKPPEVKPVLPEEDFNIIDIALYRLVQQAKEIEKELRARIRDAEADALEPRCLRPKIELIQRVVARQYNVTRSDLLSARRTANLVRPRQVAMYLAKTLTLRSLPEIGRRFGGKDHTTVLHAVRKIERLRTEDEGLDTEIRQLIAKLGG